MTDSQVGGFTTKIQQGDALQRAFSGMRQLAQTVVNDNPNLKTNNFGVLDTVERLNLISQLFSQPLAGGNKSVIDSITSMIETLSTKQADFLGELLSALATRVNNKKDSDQKINARNMVIDSLNNFTEIKCANGRSGTLSLKNSNCVLVNVVLNGQDINSAFTLELISPDGSWTKDSVEFAGLNQELSSGFGLNLRLSDSFDARLYGEQIDQEVLSLLKNKNVLDAIWDQVLSKAN